MTTIESQVRVSVAGEKDRTEVDFEGDSLNSTVHTDISLCWKKHTNQLINFKS